MSCFVRGLACTALLACPALAHAETPPAPVPSAASVPAAPALRVYMRAEARPLTFSARERGNSGAPQWCISPCDQRLMPGDYQLKLNGITADQHIALRSSGTLQGEYHSRAGARSAGWLALNVGGIIGGVFITVAALGGPSWAYLAGGGSLAAGGVVFLVTYRADRATVSFSPAEPLDVRGMPDPPPIAGSAAPREPERAGFASQARGLGFRVAF